MLSNQSVDHYKSHSIPIISAHNVDDDNRAQEQDMIPLTTCEDGCWPLYGEPQDAPSIIDIDPEPFFTRALPVSEKSNGLYEINGL